MRGLAGLIKGSITYAEEDCKGQINSLEKVLPGRVFVFELLDCENEVGDNEGQHRHIEWQRIPYPLKESLQADESGLSAEVRLPFCSQLREHLRNVLGIPYQDAGIILKAHHRAQY